MAKSPLTERILDKRVVKRYVSRGTLTDKELTKHLKDLPDMAGACEQLDLEEAPASGNGEATEGTHR